MKKIISHLVLLLFSASLFACGNPPNSASNPSKMKIEDWKDVKTDTAYFASGCFWCVEAIFQSVHGVKEAISGYSGGESKNPSYQAISSGQLKHAEAVQVIYDPMKVDFSSLLDVFFGSHDPTTLNRQGPDRGPQYRSIAFYQNEKELSLNQRQN